MSTPNFERVRSSISTSNISEQDKEHLIEIFTKVSDESLSGIAELFEQKGDWVAKFNENRCMKQEAVNSNDPTIWQKILEKEKQYLNELTYGLD